MGQHYGSKIVTSSLIFAWDGMNVKSWDDSSTQHKDLISSSVGTKYGSNALTRANGHVSFAGGGTRVCRVNFPSSNISVPTGTQGTWIWAHRFVDAGSIDHPNFGKETGNSWNGVNGFVFGTGYADDGPRWGIGGAQYNIWSNLATNTGKYRYNVWQIYCVTYSAGQTNGLKTYLLDSNGNRLVDQRTPSNVLIGTNTNDLFVGSTNNRGGNWNGDMDFIYMYDRALTEQEVFINLETVRGRVGL